MQSNELYQIAYRCAEQNNAGCAQDCVQCQYNIYNYVSDVREASLLKATATTDFHRIFTADCIREAEDNASNRRTWIMCIVIIAFVILCLMQCVRMVYTPGEESVREFRAEEQAKAAAAALAYQQAQKQPVVKPVVQQQVRSNVDERTYLRENQNKPENINRVLAYMNKHGVKDRNSDGKVNCIDYSVTFRELYGSQAELIINVNNATNFNHMFIQLRHNGKVIDVEPQGTPDRYAMNLVWGMRYNRAFNRNATSGWGGWVGP